MLAKARPHAIRSLFPGHFMAGSVAGLSPFALFALLAVLAPACTSSSSAGPPAGDAGKDSPVTGSGGASVGSGGSSGSGGAGTGGAGTGGAGGSVVPPVDAGDAGGTDTEGRDTAGESGPPTALGQAGGACPGGVYGNPLPANLTATMVRGGFGGALEGPVWVASQKALYFAQGAGTGGGRIHKYTPAENKFEVFAMGVLVAGLAMDPQGMLVAAAYDVRKVVRIDPVTGTRTDVPGGDAYMGVKFNEVNDVVVRADGNIYFSDPQFPSGTSPMSFYRLAPPPLSTLTRFYTSNNSNGVALSPDGAFIYVSTTGNGGSPVRRFALNADGSVNVNGMGTAWKEAYSDGMGVDCAGNLYLSVAGGTNTIRVVSPADQTLGDIVGLGGGFVSNSAFGDEDRKTLYITTSEALYKIQLNVPGFPN
jgi:gluconolactonase